MDTTTLTDRPRAIAATDVHKFLARHRPFRSVPRALDPNYARFANEFFELRRKYPHRDARAILAARIAHYLEPRLDQAPIVQGCFVWHVRCGYQRRYGVLAAREPLWCDSDIQALLALREACGLAAEEIITTINSAVADVLAPLLGGSSSDRGERRRPHERNG